MFDCRCVCPSVSVILHMLVGVLRVVNILLLQNIWFSRSLPKITSSKLVWCGLSSIGFYLGCKYHCHHVIMINLLITTVLLLLLGVLTYIFYTTKNTLFTTVACALFIYMLSHSLIHYTFEFRN